MAATAITPAPLTATLPVAHLRRAAMIRASWLAIGVAALAILMILSVTFGSRAVTADQVLAGIQGDTSGIAEAAVAKRIPRTILGLLVGSSLALSGAAMQAMTRNPLADPGIFGVSNGASLAVVIGIAFFGLQNPYGYMGLAVLGAAVVATFVYFVGSLGRGGATPLKLALAGAATSAAVASLISIVMLPRVDALQNYQFWQIGGVGGATWDRIATTAPVLLAATLGVFLSARIMNSLALGDDLATGLGENIVRSRLMVGIGAVVLAGVATAIAGPIGFVGLIVPHLCRLLVGPDHRWLLPFSAIVGAGLLVGADVLGRVIARPAEVQVGIVTALVGAPVFIWIVRRQKVREL